jgi:hypothetical protein
MISSLLIIRTFLVAWRSGVGLRSDSSFAACETHVCSCRAYIVVAQVGAQDLAAAIA